MSARYALAVARWVATTVGYWVRPYDMLADRRRWCWQKSTRCVLVDDDLARYITERLAATCCDLDAPDGDLCKSCLAGRHDRDRIEEDL